MGAWDVVEHKDEVNVIDGTWAFKCMQLPIGTKFNAHFCACGDQQLEGIDYFETYAPVAQWTTFHLMFILENYLHLKSKQADVNAAFLHVTLEEVEKVYVEMSCGFKQHGSKGKFSRKLSMGCIKVLCILEISQ